jgi:hypothetical protein
VNHDELLASLPEWARPHYHTLNTQVLEFTPSGPAALQPPAHTTGVTGTTRPAWTTRDAWDDDDDLEHTAWGAAEAAAQGRGAGGPVSPDVDDDEDVAEEDADEDVAEEDEDADEEAEAEAEDAEGAQDDPRNGEAEDDLAT